MDDETDFETWLKHFQSLSPNMVGPQYDFNCIDPRNVQARHMSCDKAPNPQANHALQIPPNLTRAIENTYDATFVGITEFYHESICMLQFRRTGALGDGCRCDANENAAAIHQWNTHGVPKHSSDFVGDIKSMVDNFTTLDAVLYRVALDRFVNDIAIAERIAGRRFLCNLTKVTDLLQRHPGIGQEASHANEK